MARAGGGVLGLRGFGGSRAKPLPRRSEPDSRPPARPRAMRRAGGPHTPFGTHTPAARLQTLDHGAPVSPYTVMREAGPQLDPVARANITATVMHTRHRAQVVEYKEARVVPIRKPEEA